MSTFKTKAQFFKAHLDSENQLDNSPQIQIIKDCKQTTPKQ